MSSLLQGNDIVWQVDITPEIFLIYGAHLLVIGHKISAANTRCKGAKSSTDLKCTVQIRANARGHDGKLPGSGAVFPVHLNGVRGPGSDQATKTFTHVARAHIHARMRNICTEQVRTQETVPGLRLH